MYKTIIISFLTIFSAFAAHSQQKEFECNKKWVQKIEKIAPDKAEVTPEKPGKILVFSLFTGYDHWVIPHTNEVMRILGEKTGAFEVEVSTDIYKFEKNSLKTTML